jgi:adenylate kinase family enzyme
MIIILGMAGAGKSTQCRKLEQSGDFQWFSVGQLLRDIEQGEARAEMALGKVLDDTIVTPIVRDELNRLGDSPEILLDGCPRTVGQATWLAAADDTPFVRIVVHLVVDDATAMDRLLKRKREDDTESAMKLRFEGYHRDIGHVLAEFEQQNIRVVSVDASLSENDVFAELQKALAP